MVEEKLQKMSEEDRAELSGLFEESLDQLYNETIYKKLVKLNAGKPFSDERYRGCLAGIISNGHIFFEEIMERPGLLCDVFSEISLLSMSELLHLM